MGIPPFIQQILGVLVRAAVVAVAGYLAGHANITLTDTQIGEIVAYVTPIAAMAAWAIWRNFKGRQKLLTAAASPRVMTEREVEAMVANPNVPTPSVLTPKTEVPS